MNGETLTLRYQKSFQLDYIHIIHIVQYMVRSLTNRFLIIAIM